MFSNLTTSTKFVPGVTIILGGSPPPADEKIFADIDALVRREYRDYNADNCGTLFYDIRNLLGDLGQQGALYDWDTSFSRNAPCVTIGVVVELYVDGSRRRKFRKWNINFDTMEMTCG